MPLRVLNRKPQTQAVDGRRPLRPSLTSYRHETDKSDNRSYRVPTDKTGNDETDNSILRRLSMAGAAFDEIKTAFSAALADSLEV